MRNIFLKNNTRAIPPSQRGFTIVETLVALAIFSSSIVFLIVVATGGSSNTGLAKNRLITTYLAEEGVEVVRNMRDTRVLADSTGGGWTTFMTEIDACTGSLGCNIDPTTQDVCTCSGSTCTIPYTETSGYYGYSQGSACTSPGGSQSSLFTRVINITPIVSTDAEDVLVTSTITWNQGTAVQRISYQTVLMNWQPHIQAL